MSFGFSVGDVLMVLEMTNRVRKRFVDAPVQFRSVLQDVKSLSHNLQDLDDMLPQRELSPAKETHLQEIVQGCQVVLQELELELSKFEELEPRTNRLRGQARIAWKRLTWDRKDIDRYRDRLTSNTNALSLFLHQISVNVGHATKAGIDQLHALQQEQRQNQQRQLMLDWIKPTQIDYARQQSELRDRRKGGTGQWLLESHEYFDWVDRRKPTLLCSGMPGAGKTMLTSIVVDSLFERFSLDSKVGIAYVYCNFNRRHDQGSKELLASILRQFVEQQTHIPECIERLYEAHKRKGTRPSRDELTKTLKLLLAAFSKTFIVVDALDELQASIGDRKDFLSRIFELRDSGEASIFVTTRANPHIEKEFQEATILQVRASDKDIEAYLDGRMHELPISVQDDPDFQDHIKSTVIGAINGMFLLAKLDMDSLLGSRSRKAFKIKLEKIKRRTTITHDHIADSGTSLYDQSYYEALERIDIQGADDKIAMDALCWIALAKRPLTTVELLHALAVEEGEPELDNENLPDIREITSACAGLIISSEATGTVDFMHATFREYLSRKHEVWFPLGHEKIARTCMTYMSFTTFTDGPLPFSYSHPTDICVFLHQNPLYGYASRYWGSHVRGSAMEAEHLVLEFLASQARLSPSPPFRRFRKPQEWEPRISPVYLPTTGVHIAACFGLVNSLSTLLLDNPFSAHVEDNFKRTPLSYAAQSGHIMAIQVLLERGAKLDVRDQWDETPLRMAVNERKLEAVKLLLERGADPDCSTSSTRGAQLERDLKDAGSRSSVPLTYDNLSGSLHYSPKWTLLFYGVKSGDLEMTRMLLEHGAHVNMKSLHGRTPLHKAVQNGNLEMSRLLLQYGAQVNVTDDFKGSPLHYAASSRYLELAQLLLQYGAQADLKDHLGYSPLYYVARSQQKTTSGKDVDALVYSLLERDADSDLKDCDDRSILSHATGSLGEASVRLLLDRGADPDSRDVKNRSPLSYASESGSARAVALLLERQVEIDAPCTGNDIQDVIHETASGFLRSDVDDRGWTPLVYAVRRKNQDGQSIVKILLEKGASANWTDAEGRSLLKYAMCWKKSEEMCKMLRGNGAVLSD